MSFFKNATVTSILISQLFGYGSAVSPDVAQAHMPQLSKSEAEARLQELKDALRKDFDADTLHSIFNVKEFGFEMKMFDPKKINPEKAVAQGKKDYEWYRGLLRLDEKIMDAPAILAHYFDELRIVEIKYGIDKRIAVGFYGIESDFGRNKGDYIAPNALATLYVFGDKESRKYALAEFKPLIRYAKLRGISVYSLTSSRMAAIGCGQFIPSSLISLFIGKNGHVKTANPFDPVDCFHSIGNFLTNRWDRTKNGLTPIEGSKNWNAIGSYNKNSEPFIKAVIKLSTSLPYRH